MTEVTKNQFSDAKAKTTSGAVTSETATTSKDAATVLDQAKNVASNVAGQAKDLAGQAKDMISHSVGDQQEKSAGDLGNVAKALRQTSRQLDGNIASPYVGQVADQVDRAAEFLRTANVKEIVGGVESFARREPLLFLGGAFALGILSARFLKSSSHHQSSALQGNQSSSHQGNRSMSQHTQGMQNNANAQHTQGMQHNQGTQHTQGMQHAQNTQQQSSMKTNFNNPGQR